MITTYKLKAGYTLVFEKIPFAETVSVGLFVKSGSMYEKKEENGISHFIEHMLFKGTKKRSAKKISEEMDFAGGELNACTSRESTVFYARTLKDKLSLSLDILSDMYFNSLFNEKDIELERKVICEEILMYEDSPEDVALDYLPSLMWEGDPLGYEIAGSIETVNKITREMMISYFKSHYTPENTVISVAGAFLEDELISLCERYFDHGENREALTSASPVFKPSVKIITKDIEQAHLSVGYNAYSIYSDKLYALAVLNNCLGVSASSRLFQSLREQRGLCYSIYSYTSSFPQTGMIGIYAGLNSTKTDICERLIFEETERLKNEKISSYELSKAKSQMKCAILMSRESVSSRMNENGKNMLLLGKTIEDSEIIRKIENVESDNVLAVSQEIFRNENKTTLILNNQEV